MSKIEGKEEKKEDLSCQASGHLFTRGLALTAPLENKTLVERIFHALPPSSFMSHWPSI
jgi:hypothetical protein